MFLIAALLFPLLHPNEADIDAAANAAAYAALALGLNIVVGFAGLLDLGYAAFFAIGAYAYGILNSFQLAPPWHPAYAPLAALHLVEKIASPAGDVVHFTVSFWLMLPVSATFAAISGLLFGAPTLRLRGDYLAIVTLGFGEIVPIIVRNCPSVTNGAMGLNGIAPPSLLGQSFGVSATPYYYVGLMLVAALMFVSARLAYSRIGRAWMAIREDEVAAAAMGINCSAMKLLAFMIGAGFAGITGTFYVAKLQTATPEMFGFPVSTMILVMIVFGGIGSVSGVALGAIILSLLQSWWLPDLSDWLHAAGRALNSAWLQQVDLAAATELIFGILLVAMMLYRREGLIPANGRRSLSVDAVAAATKERAKNFPFPLGLGSEADKGRREGGAQHLPALDAKNLTVHFGGLVALNSVNLTVPPHTLIALIGPNGSGKSTLFNAIAGLTPIATGTIHLDGEPITGLGPHDILARGVARTFQNIRLFSNLSVMDNVLIGQHARLVSGPLAAIFRPPGTRAEERDARDNVIAILSMFGDRLLPVLDQPVCRLSYANRRRVEIARALASRPRVLLLDEPAAGMNPAETLQLAAQIEALRRLPLTILLIEHKFDLVTRLADHVIVLHHGEIIAEGKPAELRTDPRVRGAYLGYAA